MTTNIGQIYYNLETEEGLKSNCLDDKGMIKSNLIQNKWVYKLGIQAPPNTKFLINQKTILIGQGGIYELEEDGIIIKTLSLSSLEAKNVIIDFVYEEQEM